MSVPRLKECCQFCIIHHIIGVGSSSNKVYEQHQGLLLNQLDEGAWGEESLAILDRVVKYQGYFLSPEVILALLPDSTKDLCLKECPLLTEECLNIALHRCQHLQTLDLTENPLLAMSTVTLFGTSGTFLLSSLTSVVLECCSQVNDSHIQNLLRNAPALQHLNIAQCEITDQVFLLDEQKQLAREASLGAQMKGILEFDSCLQSVDLSRCSDFTSTGVRHLCTLCGPSLRSVNVAWTKVDCTAFLYLSGMGLPSAVEFFMSSGAMSSEVMEPLVYNLHQFDAICLDITRKWKEDREKDLGQTNTGSQGENQPTLVDIEDINPDFVPPDPGSQAAAPSPDDDDHRCTSSKPSDRDENQSLKTSSVCEKNTEQTDSSNNSLPTLPTICMDALFHGSQIPMERDAVEKEFNRVLSAACDNMSNSRTQSGTCRYQSYFEEKDLTRAYHCKDENTQENMGKKIPCELENVDSNGKLCGEETVCGGTKPAVPTDQCWDKKAVTSDSSTSQEEEYKYPLYVSSSEFVGSSLRKKLPFLSERDIPSEETMHKNGVCDKTFFKSSINSIFFTASVFREEDLGLRCFQKLLTTNRDMLSITLYSGINGNFLRDNVLDLISTYARGLEYLCVEGSDKLTFTGIVEIAKHCKSLSSVDLTGVSFLGDEGISHLVNSLPLTRLKLAETRITAACLHLIAALPVAQKLEEIDLSWCEEIENSLAINSLVSACPQLHKLMLRECCISNDTLSHIARNSHLIAELSLASNMNVMRDESVILLSEHLPLLATIDLGWNSYLTNQSIAALLSNCRLLQHANLEGLKLLTSSPFLPLISVPEALCDSMEKARQEWHESQPGKNSEFKVELSKLSCLPHRSTTHCTSLRYVNLTYCDFVEDSVLQQIVTVTHGGIEMLDYYGNRVELVQASLERFLIEHIERRGQLD